MMLKKVFVAAILGISVFGLVLGDTALGVVDCYEYTGNQTVCGAAAGVFPCSGQVGGPVGAPCGIFIQYFGTISFPETIANGGGYVLDYTVGHLCAKVGDCKYTRNASTGLIECQLDATTITDDIAGENILNTDLPCPEC